METLKETVRNGKRTYCKDVLNVEVVDVVPEGAMSILRLK